MSEKLGAPLNIDRFRGSRIRNRVYRVGIELEGGWTKLPSGVRALQHDGSIQGLLDPSGNPLHVGELPSSPLTLEEWGKWLRKHYPQIVNQSCGMHVHLSFRTALTYSRLMCPEYPGTIVNEITRWAKHENLPKDHTIWSRLKGKSVYCQHVYSADEQVRNTSKDHNRERAGHRYTVINYCWARVSTLECRLLPMMDTAERAERLVQEYIDITNAFLMATGKREQASKIDIDVDAEERREERRIFA